MRPRGAEAVERSVGRTPALPVCNGGLKVHPRGTTVQTGGQNVVAVLNDSAGSCYVRSRLARGSLS
jgi:hypothetical protein